MNHCIFLNYVGEILNVKHISLLDLCSFNLKIFAHADITNATNKDELS